MELHIKRESLLVALTNVMGLAGRGAGTMDAGKMTALGCVKITVANRALTMQATNLQIDLATAPVEASVTDEGTVLVGARKLFELVRAVPDGCELKLSTRNLVESDAKWLHVYAGRSKYRLATLPVAEFPASAIESHGPTSTIGIESGQLSSALELTTFAICSSPERGVMYGLLMAPEANGRLRFVATDGARLSACVVPHNGNADETTKVQAIVPRDTAALLRSLLDDSKAEVTLTFAPRMIEVKTARVTLRSSLIEGKYPDFTAVIPTAFQASARTNRDELRQSINRSKIVLQDEKPVRVACTGEHLTIQASTPGKEGSESTEHLSIIGDAGSFQLAINPKFLLDALDAVEGDDVEIQVNSASTPVMVRAPSQTDQLHIIMPVRGAD